MGTPKPFYKHRQGISAVPTIFTSCTPKAINQSNTPQSSRIKPNSKKRRKILSCKLNKSFQQLSINMQHSGNLLNGRSIIIPKFASQYKSGIHTQ